MLNARVTSLAKMATSMKVENGVEVFTFHNPAKRKAQKKDDAVPKKKQKQQKQQKEQEQQAHPSVSNITLESARHEVRTFGITGFDGKSKIEAELSVLKKLGAKIPKNWERKMERKRKNLEYERRRQDIKTGVKTKNVSLADPNKPKDKFEKKTKKEGGVVFDSKVGKYKDGVQFISPEEIKKITSTVGKKK